MERMEEAEALLRAELVNAQVTGERFLLWRIHTALGQLHQMMDRPDIAEEDKSVARSLIVELDATVSDEKLKQNFRQRAFEAL